MQGRVTAMHSRQVSNPTFTYTYPRPNYILVLTLASHHSQQNGNSSTFLKPIHTSARCLNGLVLNETALC